MKRKRTPFIISIVICVILCSLMGCLLGKETPNDPDSQGYDSPSTLPAVKDDAINNASEQEDSVEQNKANEEIVEETISTTPSQEPVTTIPQQEPTTEPYVEEPTTPQTEQPTTTPEVTEDSSAEETTSPTYDSSNDLGEF